MSLGVAAAEMCRAARAEERAAVVAWCQRQSVEATENFRQYGDRWYLGYVDGMADIIDRLTIEGFGEPTRRTEPRHPRCYGEGCPWCLAHDSMRPIETEKK